MSETNPLPIQRSARLHSRAYAALATLLGIASLSACVTINIYFPAAAAEKAADKIIDEVWQLKDGGTPKPATPAPAQK